jgi:tryptophan halogenase
MPIPDSLAYKWEQFRAAGRLVINNDELFTPSSWVAVALGQGLMPEHYDPLADLPDSRQLDQRLSELRRLARSTAESLTAHQDFLVPQWPIPG